MNQIVTAERFVGQVLSAENRDHFFASMPSHIRPAVFERNLMNALMANPDLMRHPPALIFREVAKAAGLGLLLDPILGEAYIVIAYNYKTRQQEPQLRVGYKGTIKLARQSNNVNAVYCHEVHDNDHVEVDLGFPKVFHHKPKLFGNRGPLVGYVALIGFKDGTFDFEPLSVEQCHAIRDRSDAWKAFKEGKIKSTPWSTDDVEMCKKTALRRLMKRQGQSSEMAEAFQIEDRAEFPNFGTSSPAVPRISQTAQDQPTIEAKKGETPEVEIDQTKPHAIIKLDGETFKQWGERWIAAYAQSTTTEETDQWDKMNAATLDRLCDAEPDLWNRDLVIRAGTIIDRIKNPPVETKKEPEKPAETKAADKTSAKAKPAAKAKGKAKADPISSGPMKVEAPDFSKDYDGWIVWATAQINAATAETLESFWNENIEPHGDDLFPPDVEDLMSVYRKAEQRVSP